MDNVDRLWLLSMMTLGCVGGDDTTATNDSDSTTGSTSGGPGGETTGDQETSADTTAGNDTGTDGETTAGMETDGTSSSGGTDSGTDSGTSSDGSSEGSSTGVEQVSPLVEACVAAYTNYFDCNGGGYSEEELLQLCTQYEGYLEMYYGDECLGVQTDYLACLSELSCKELADMPPEGEACSEAYAAGHEACPDLFSFCSGGGGGNGPDGCQIDAMGCLDGNDYAVECDATTCTCMVNGVDGATFPSPGPDACLEDGFNDMAEMACGFPDDIFF